MIPSSPSLLAEQLRAAHNLFEEATRSNALASGAETLGARLLAFDAQPAQQPLAVWARDFRTALPAEGQRDLVDLAWALALELECNAAAAVFHLGDALCVRKCLLDREVLDAAGEIGAKPTLDALRTVLETWIHRGAAGGGPILGWMRDLHHRLAVT